jgi:hypothetical protein
MERINEVIKKGQALSKYKQSSTSTLIKKEDHFEMSVYAGELTKRCIAENTVKLKHSFPALEDGFYDVFYERLKANNYTDERLNDAIGHVIDNCIYPAPTIAQFISFDKRIKLYTYNQVLKMNDESQSAFVTHRPVKMEGQSLPMYAHLNDIEKYKLKLWNK